MSIYIRVYTLPQATYVHIFIYKKKLNNFYMHIFSHARGCCIICRARITCGNIGFKCPPMRITNKNKFM